MEQKYALARQLHRIFTEEVFRKQRTILLEACETERMMLLWQILFETDIRDKDLLEERIYHYGSLLTDEDKFERELFVCLVTLLDLL